VPSGDLIIQGAYTVVEGLTWTGAGTIKLNNSDHCRVSRFRVMHQGGGSWISCTGTSKYCRIDHNDFGPQNTGGNMIQVAGVTGQIVQFTRIDHNFFHDVHFSGGNGWESIRSGLSGWTFSKAYTVIEQNLFKADTNDPEVISLKSSNNTLRYNTMRASAGQFSLRHGNGTSVYGNFILGDGVGGAQGIRVCGGDHKLYNNYIEAVGTPGIMLEGGESDDKTGALTDHKQVYNTQVVFNTIVNSRGVDVGNGHPLKPINSVVAYNILQGTGPLLAEAAGSVGTKFLGNIVNGGAAGVDSGVMMIDPKLLKVGEIFRIATGSPAIDSGDMAMFPYVTDDAEGKPRTKADIGAFEVSSAPAKYGLLEESDVGPMAP